MADLVNRLLIADPGVPAMKQNDILASAWQANTGAVQDWIARQRAISAQRGLWNDQTGLPTQAGVVDAAGQIGNALLMGSTAPGVRAYHGSPYSFDRFDASKIGTGEGAQAFGHGLYFAENQGVARGYRDALADRKLVWPNDEGAQLHAELPPHLRQQYRSDIEAGRDPTSWLANLADGAQRHAEYVQGGGRRSVDYGPDGGFALAETARKLGAQPLPKAESAGKMYEVNIAADPESFLHWDKPLSEQSQQVREALAKVPWAEPYLQSGKFTGGQIAPQTAEGAMQLREAGIPGIRYLDQNSRGAGEGTHNYVVFDPATIEILRKYGIAGLLGGGAVAEASQ